MNCSDVQFLLGPMVDGEVASTDRSAFLLHVGSCASCKRSYELELVAKSLVRGSLPRRDAPLDVRRSVLAAITAESNRSSRPFLRRLADAVPVPAAAAAVLAIVAYFIFVPTGGPSTLDDMIAHTGPTDIMVQTASNFALLQEGKLKPSLVTCSPESMYGFLSAQHLPFEALVRPMDRCDGYSALVNEFDGVRLAHVVYSMGNDLLYVYQVRKDEALADGRRLSMPMAGRDAVVKTGWYTDPQHPGCNVVVWEEGGTICAATSTMTKPRMLALLATR